MVEIFKTNVQEKKQANTLVALLSDRFSGFSIGFDLEDCDKILRIEGRNINPSTIIEAMQSQGYSCEILI